MSKSSYFKWLENRLIQLLGKVSFWIVFSAFPRHVFFQPILNGYQWSYKLPSDYQKEFKEKTIHCANKNLTQSTYHFIYS